MRALLAAAVMALMVATVAAPALTCANCGAVADDAAKGWRAYLDDEGQAVTFCPECAREEFGNAHHAG